MNKQFAHRFPDTEFWIDKDPETTGDKIYLGLFLALCLFSAILFGNLLFIIIVSILSVFIMLSYSTSPLQAKCKITKDGIQYEKDFFNWEGIRYFDIVENNLDNSKSYIRLSFQNYLNQHTYIPIPKHVQKDTLYAILQLHVEENPSQKLSIIEMLMLRFFKW